MAKAYTLVEWNCVLILSVFLEVLKLRANDVSTTRTPQVISQNLCCAVHNWTLTCPNALSKSLSPHPALARRPDNPLPSIRRNTSPTIMNGVSSGLRSAPIHHQRHITIQLLLYLPAPSSFRFDDAI